MAQSAILLGTGGPVVPSDITTGSVTDGSFTFNYFKTGKLYFGWLAVPSGANDLRIDGDVTNSADRLASLLGFTINAYYYNPVPSSTTTLAYGGSPGSWLGISSNVKVLVGFLVN